MKALAFNPKTDQFYLSELPVPHLDGTDVLIEVDAQIGLWKPMVPNMNDSWVPGLDVSGHIVEKGPKVEQGKIGDQVLCHGDMFRPHGGFAEYTVQDSGTLIEA